MRESIESLVINAKWLWLQSNNIRPPYWFLFPEEGQWNCPKHRTFKSLSSEQSRKESKASNKLFFFIVRVYQEKMALEVWWETLAVMEQRYVMHVNNINLSQEWQPIYFILYNVFQHIWLQWSIRESLRKFPCRIQWNYYAQTIIFGLN